MLAHKGRARGVVFRNYETLESDAVLIATGYGTKLSGRFRPTFQYRKNYGNGELRAWREVMAKDKDDCGH